MPFICEKKPHSLSGFVESRLAALEMQMKEDMRHTTSSSCSDTTPNPRTYSAYVDNVVQNNQRQQTSCASDHADGAIIYIIGL